MTQRWSSLVLPALTVFALSVLAGRPCVQKQFGRDRIVCVCNASYCDTVDQIPTLAEGQFVQYTSNIGGLRFEQTSGEFEATKFKYGMHMRVNEYEIYQNIFGFGAAFTDAAGININSLRFDTQENLMKSYFSPEGIELNIGRVPIAGCDFSTHTYSYNDVEGDVHMKHFNLTTEDFTLKIPLIKRAAAMSQRPLYLLGTAWTAPPWMKTNRAYAGTGFLIREYYQAWARYHLKFLDAYEMEGLPFWAISTGNEPGNGITLPGTFNCMAWKPASQMAWVRDFLGPAIRSSQHSETKIITCDDQRYSLPLWVKAMKADEAAAQYIDGIGVHWYFENFFPPAIMDLTHMSFPNKFILASEACTGYSPLDLEKVILGSWDRAEAYMGSILTDLNHWVTGWVDWNLALSPTGAPNWANNFVDAGIIVNSEDDEFYKQPMFYALGHFAKFIPEGSVRIAITPNEKHGVESMAFKTPDNTVVIILYNKKSTEFPVTIMDPQHGYINVILSKRSFQTIIYWN